MLGFRESHIKVSITFARLIFIYLIMSIPFKVMEIIPAFSDIRPVTMLIPIYAVLYGPLGCLAYACGNLITDIISGSLRYSSVAGFVGNFIGPYIIYLYWVRISGDTIRLDGFRSILVHASVIALSAAVTDLIIAPAVYFFYPQVDVWLFAKLLFSNHFLFPVMIGTPMIILLQEELRKEPIRAIRNIREGSDS